MEKRIQKKVNLFKNDNFLFDVISSIQDGISVIDDEFNIIFVNSTMEKWYKFSLPLIGKKCYKAYHFRNDICDNCPSYRTLQTNESSYENVPKRDDKGNIIGWIGLYTFPFVDNFNGSLKGVVEYVRDITEQKKAEEIVRKNEERFKALVESTSDWIWEINEYDTYTYVSPKVHDLLGYEMDEVIGKKPFDLMPFDEAERIKNIFYSFKKDKKPFSNLININIHKKGYHVIIETSGVPFFDSKGLFKGYRGIDRDVTQRFKVEELLRKKECELEKRLKELEKFYEVTINRELRMIQLKREIDKLKYELEKYKKLEEK